MQGLFDTRPVALLDGVLIIAIGVGVMALLEAEKAIVQRIGRRRAPGHAAGTRA